MPDSPSDPALRLKSGSGRTRRAKPRSQGVTPAASEHPYELWGVDEAPWSKQLAARQPKYFPVFCRNCDTLMHATKRKIGLKLVCPDCGAKTVVKPPVEKKPTRDVLVPAGQEYQLDEATAPGARPVPSFLSGSVPRERPVGGSIPSTQPKCPPLPLVQGVGRMLWRPPLPSWWLGLGLHWMFVLLLGTGVTAVLGAGTNAFVLVCSLAAACVLGSIGLAASCALWLAIVCESSDGNDRLYTPPAITDWFGSLFHVLLPSSIAVIPGWILSRTLGNGSPELMSVWLAGSWLLLFPLMQLSALAGSSPFDLFSARLFGTWLRRPGHWLLFYVESVLLIAACLWAMAHWPKALSGSMWTAAPLIVAASLVYFRLLGRLGWWLAESLPIEDAE